MNPTSLAQLRKTLAYLYPSKADIRRVAYDAEIDTGDIPVNGSAEALWHALLDEANKQHQVEQLLKIIDGEYPNNAGSVRSMRQISPQFQ